MSSPLIESSHQSAFPVRGSTASSSTSGATSPPSPPARTRFDSSSLFQAQLSHLLSVKLKASRWEKGDKEKNRALSRSIAEAVKSNMIEVEPKGFKYIVQVHLVENLGQGGRADLACHWEDTDSVIQDMYSNDSLICTVLCFAIRA